MIMAGQDSDGISRLPIPDTNCLIIGGRNNPWVTAMEESCSNIIQVTKQSECAFPLLVIPDLQPFFIFVYYLSPYLDFVVVSSRNEDWLLEVEINATNWAIVFIKLVDQRANSIIPKLNHTAVKGSKNPWSSWME